MSVACQTNIHSITSLAGAKRSAKSRRCRPGLKKTAMGMMDETHGGTVEIPAYHLDGSFGDHKMVCEDFS